MTDPLKSSSFVYCSQGPVPKYVWIPTGMYYDLHHRFQIHPDAGIDMTGMTNHPPPLDLPFVRQLTEPHFHRLKAYEQFSMVDRINNKSIIKLPIRNNNIDLLVLVDSEKVSSPNQYARHYQSYLFVNKTRLYTNDSYFNPAGEGSNATRISTKSCRTFHYCGRLPFDNTVHYFLEGVPFLHAIPYTVFIISGRYF